MSDKNKPHENSDLGRRRAIKTIGAATFAGMLPAAFAQSARKVKIGFVTPLTGYLAGFGEGDKYTIDAMHQILKDGVMVGGKRHPVEVIVKNSESNSNKAGELAANLILKDKIDLMLVGAAPETINPVADQCELNGIPCISTLSPWQPVFFGRGGKPETGFDWTYHFFWGLEDVIETFMDMWKSANTNNVIGGLFPNDTDGNAWGDPKFGFPAAIKKAGFKLHDPGRYQVMNSDFSAQIASYKNAGCEILVGNMIPPDVKTFWTQAKQQGFRPKVMSVGKALLFPSSVEAMGDLADGLTAEVWWSPYHPFKSSLTGVSAAQLAESYETSTKKQWTQPIGFSHALFEVAVDVLKRTKSIDDKASIRDAIAATNLNTIVGTVAWGKGPVKNVTKTALVGGQWVKGKKFKYDLVIVNNKLAPHILPNGKLKLLS